MRAFLMQSQSETPETPGARDDRLGNRAAPNGRAGIAPANNRTRTKESPAPTAIRRDAGLCGCKVADQAAPYA